MLKLLSTDEHRHTQVLTYRHKYMYTDARAQLRVHVCKSDDGYATYVSNRHLLQICTRLYGRMPVLHSNPHLFGVREILYNLISYR